MARKFLNSDFTLKNMMKINVGLVMLFAFCDIVIIIFFQGLVSSIEWKMEIIKIFVLLFLGMVMMLLLFGLKMKRKIVGYALGTEMLIFSVILFVSLIKGYCNIYNVINPSLFLIYAILTIVAYLTSRKASRKLCEKVSLGENKEDKVDNKLENGAFNGLVLCTIAFSRSLTMDGTYIVNCIISFLICFFWSTFGLFMFVMKPMDN